MSPDSSAQQDLVVGLARFVRAELGAILAGWTARIAALPPSGPSLLENGASVLEWLASSLEARARQGEATEALPSADSFSAARAIAELALLAETIDELRPATTDTVARDALHRVIDAAIASSLARDSDDGERLRKRLRLAAAVTLAGSWDIDRSSGAVRADARSRELLGMAEGRPPTLEALTSQLDPDDRARVRDGIAMTLGSGGPFQEECRTLRPDAVGPRWIAIAGEMHQHLSATSPRLLGIVHDVTDRKRTEEAHTRVVEELSRAVHISEMFIGILSHDLRNPLSAVQAGVQLLGAQLTDERSTRVLSRMVSSSARMVRMIDQLLDFTRARIGQGIPLHREPADLASLVRDVVDEARTSSPAADVRIAARGDTCGAWDRDRLAQVLSNLVGNAIQHGDPAQPIEVSLDGGDADVVALSMRNRGVVPPDLLPVLFNPFRGTLQKRGKSSGLGLGLYVARQIALAHGGELEVESAGAETVFELRLPRAAQPPTQVARDVAREEEVAAFERLAAPLTSTVTAQMFGATTLKERAPLEHARIVTHYRALLDTALHRKAYRGHGEGLGDDLRAMAERLGELGAGPREVTMVHTEALADAVRGVPAARTAALLSEGRLLALELMGNLASYYRRRARGELSAERLDAKGG